MWWSLWRRPEPGDGTKENYVGMLPAVWCRWKRQRREETGDHIGGGRQKSGVASPEMPKGNPKSCMGTIQEDGWNRCAGALVREYVCLGLFQEGVGAECPVWLAGVCCVRGSLIALVVLGGRPVPSLHSGKPLETFGKISLSSVWRTDWKGSRENRGN